jgi:hypothetical protein
MSKEPSGPKVPAAPTRGKQRAAQPQGVDMKRLASCLALAALIGLQACQDSTQPTAPSAPELSEVGIDASANLLARVAMFGGLLFGNRVTSTTSFGPGQYEVTFNRNVTGCAYVATTNNANVQAMQVYTAGGHLSVNGVYVETKNQGGGLTAAPFNLIVTCGGTGIRYAVVGYTDNLVRGTAGVTLSGSSGIYTVTFPTAVNTCAFLATVADPSNALVFNPAGVYTANGAATNQVYIETKNIGGGIQAGVPFHLAVVCAGTNNRFVVVKAGGATARGSAGTSSAKLSTGNFNVNMGRSLAACAVVGTRGSFNTAVPFNPGTVELTAGSNANSTGIQTRDLLFFGGNLNSLAFHVAAVC